MPSTIDQGTCDDRRGAHDSLKRSIVKLAIASAVVVIAFGYFALNFEVESQHIQYIEGWTQIVLTGFSIGVFLLTSIGLVALGVEIIDRCIRK